MNNTSELLANFAQLLSFYILLNDNTAEKLSQRLERLEELINRLTVINLHDTH